MVRICEDKYEVDSKYNKYFEEYEFELSDFQKYAIESIIEGNHCLVTAHTGSGKTLPAEFAIKYFKKIGKKIIYTSPIKALSNQKFYDFKRKFPDISIGLFTGDIKTNPEADVLIMTTEILMNYLFNIKENESIVSNLDFNIDIQNELGCVVFDEVHYINDMHRGEVWEKTILMLPEHVQMIMLSATIDGPEKFAGWCEKRYNNKEVYLCSTIKRVVPLGHYSYVTAIELFYKKLKDKDLEAKLRKETSGLIEIQSSNGKFNEINMDKIKNVLELMKKKDIYMKRGNVLNQLCKYLKDRDMLPGIVFIFSRKLVEQAAKEITVNLFDDDSNIPYTIKTECDALIRKLPNSDEYLNLDEYKELIKLLEKGVGIHHSGMIPVLREIVEMMISKKYIKLLFATESFAIGLDCPIKTAIFPALRKFDGNGMRDLYSHEYTQMAGRAGRRGIDKVGYIVHCNNLFEMPFKSTYRQMLSGVPQKLVSKYNISFSVILNLIKNGRSNELINFSEKTMLNEKIKFQLDANMAEKSIIKGKYEVSENQINNCIKTPLGQIIEYNKIMTEIENMKANKRKNAIRKAANIKDMYKSFSTDYMVYLKSIEYTNEIKQIDDDFINLKNIIKSGTENICEMLVKSTFIELDDDNEYRLIERGRIASMIAEINNLVFSELIIKMDKFKDFTGEEIVCSLSFMIDIKTNENIKSNIVNCKNNNVSVLVKNIDSELLNYNILESNFNIISGINYDNKNYDIPDIIEGWLNCNDEMECRNYIKDIINTKYEIMTGEFVKCLLKICAIIKEINKMCEELGYIELLNKMENIEEKILKYVVTPQSLYL
jgi:superfamily II RNA helicase